MTLRNTALVVGIVVVAVISPSSQAGTLFYSGTLSTSSPTFHPSAASTVGTAVQYYNSQPFKVDTSGAYSFEAASPNTSTGLSNALDTLLLLYTTTFTPAAPGTATSTNDDYTGALSVLPGPYLGTVAPATTGFAGLQPGSRLGGTATSTVALTAGTQYYLVESSFRSTDFVPTGTNAQPVGTYYIGISGPGAILVPEPASIAAIGGLVTLALKRRTRRANA